MKETKQISPMAQVIGWLFTLLTILIIILAIVFVAKLIVQVASGN